MHPSYQPSRAELEENMRVDATFSEAIQALAQPVRIRHISRPRKSLDRAGRRKSTLESMGCLRGASSQKELVHFTAGRELTAGNRPQYPPKDKRSGSWRQIRPFIEGLSSPAPVWHP